ncbi:MAG: hypothetical protein GXN92_02040 [Candidatus Micrarchaeota archaeon]|nr:hypothetical protein [Candidatus Micrarchaeota archaeon]
MKGQLSLEVLLVLGLIFVFLIPILFYFFYEYMLVSDHMTREYAIQWIMDLERVAENVYYGGPGTRIVMDQMLPTSIKSIQVKEVSNGTLVVYEFVDGTQIVSYFPMSVVLAGGNWDALTSFKIKVENKNGTVEISPAS